MGCDIHLAVQIRRHGRWVREEPLIKNDGDSYSFKRCPLVRRDYDLGQNYLLFAALAGVRNRFREAAPSGEPGLAIASTIELQAIAPHRGLPKDFSDELDDWGWHEGTSMGDHSFTHMTLAEIDAYDWNRLVVQERVINAVERDRMFRQNDPYPSTHCGGAGGGGIYYVTLTEMDEAIKGGKVDPLMHAKIVWGKPIRNDIYAFFELCDDLRAKYDPYDVRLVMGFDS